MLKNMWNEMNELFTPKERVLVLMVLVPTFSLGIYLMVWTWSLALGKLFF